MKKILLSLFLVVATLGFAQQNIVISPQSVELPVAPLLTIYVYQQLADDSLVEFVGQFSGDDKGLVVVVVKGAQRKGHIDSPSLILEFLYGSEYSLSHSVKAF